MFVLTCATLLHDRNHNFFLDIGFRRTEAPPRSVCGTPQVCVTPKSPPTRNSEKDTIATAATAAAAAAAV
jgi:hypothetical protein